MRGRVCAHRECVRPVRAYGVCRLHLAQILAAGRASTHCTPKVLRLDRLTLARHLAR